MIILAYIALGMLAGVFSGLVGIGGGIVLVPFLVYLFGLSQQAAQGTTLAMLILPVGILGAMEYYRHGFVDLKLVALLAVGFVVGSLFGAKLALILPTVMLKRIFGATLLVAGLRMLFSQ